MGRLLGIDYGEKRVGIALSDPLGMFAYGLDTLPNESAKKLVTRLKVFIAEHDVETIVLGLPLKTTGEHAAAAESVQAFGEQLASETGVQVHYQDERFTSVVAQQALRDQGVKPSRAKHLIDKTSAALILQQYMDSRSSQTTGQ